jgi:hypothetical protein
MKHMGITSTGALGDNPSPVAGDSGLGFLVMRCNLPHEKLFERKYPQCSLQIAELKMVPK